MATKVRTEVLSCLVRKAWAGSLELFAPCLLPIYLRVFPCAAFVIRVAQVTFPPNVGNIQVFGSCEKGFPAVPFLVAIDPTFPGSGSGSALRHQAAGFVGISESSLDSN